MAKLSASAKKRLLKTLAFILGFLSLGLLAYLAFLPLYPLLQYRLKQPAAGGSQLSQASDSSALYKALQPEAEPRPPAMPAAEIAKSPNRVIIKKIGVNSPIIEAPNEQWKSALNRGAWRVPQTSTPDRGGNTVISGHRYKYLPPNNLTFYLLDKLAEGDLISVIWNNRQYDYEVMGSKIVPPEEISILDPTAKPILTLFTCDPIWTEKNRLVVTAELVN